MWGLLILGLLSSAEGEFRCSGQRLVVDSSCGDTVTLPCHFSWGGSPPPLKYELVWQLRRRGLDFVVYDDDMKTPTNQQQNGKFTNRTSVQAGWASHGNATLQLMGVSESDQGVYTCDLLTLSPYARKICTEIQLTVKTDSTGCGTTRSQDVYLGAPVQLSCLSRPACLPSHKRGITWRFLATNSEKEVELPRVARAADSAPQVSVGSDGTLILKAASAVDSGTYCCYLMGTDRCSGIHLHVLDLESEATVPSPTSDSLKRLIYISIGVSVVVLTIAVVVLLGVRRWKSRDHAAKKKHCEEKNDSEPGNARNLDNDNSITKLLPEIIYESRASPITRLPGEACLVAFSVNPAATLMA